MSTGNFVLSFIKDLIGNDSSTNTSGDTYTCHNEDNGNDVNIGIDMSNLINIGANSEFNNITIGSISCNVNIR